MNTTLNPPPTDREREMLAEWVGKIVHASEMGNNTGNVFDYAEYMLTEFRSRYGVTGAEQMPYIHANFDLDKVLSEAVSIGELNPESAENVRRTMLKYGFCEEKPDPIRDPEDITMKEVIKMLPHDKTLTIFDSDCMGVITLDDGLADWQFNSLPELIAILKGGKSD